MSDPAVTSCPSCGAAAAGNFCASCGTALGVRRCACGTEARPADRFCRSCGQSLTGASAPSEPRLPWVVAGILSCIAIAAVVYAAGSRGQAAAPQMANAGSAAAGASTAGPAARAPDISNLTPREQFARLNDRIFAAAESGDSTTVINFWPMAAGAYDNLLPGDRDIDSRYHMATLYLLVGQFPATLALADTIMTESPGNLLGWYLRGVVAEFQEDSVRMNEVRREFERGFDAELAKGLDEYVHHADLLREYRNTGGRTP